MSLSNFVNEETIFIYEGGDHPQQLFEWIAPILLEKGFVKDAFQANIIKREENYPTGIALTHISETFPGVAIPHTDSVYVLQERVIPIKLNKPVAFKEMINPGNDVSVGFVFMILNKDADSQAKILPAIMDYLRDTPADDLAALFNAKDEAEIYKYINNNK